jgi:hypothetical protein
VGPDPDSKHTVLKVGIAVIAETSENLQQLTRLIRINKDFENVASSNVRVTATNTNYIYEKVWNRLN